MKKKKINFPARELLCGVCMFSHVCVHFLRGLQFPTTSQRCACEVNRCVCIVPVRVSMSVRVWALQWEGILPRLGSRLPPSAAGLDSTRLLTSNWNKRVGKGFSYLFMFIFLKCMYGLHLFQCLLLEMFWVFIKKFGEGFVTRSMPS